MGQQRRWIARSKPSFLLTHAWNAEMGRTKGGKSGHTVLVGLLKQRRLRLIDLIVVDTYVDRGKRGNGGHLAAREKG